MGILRLLDAFDLIAENRYLAWVEAGRPSDASPQRSVLRRRARKSFEAVLYEELSRLLDRASTVTDTTEREALLEAAAAMQTRLLVALERKQQMRLARILEETIQLRLSMIDRMP